MSELKADLLGTARPKIIEHFKEANKGAKGEEYLKKLLESLMFRQDTAVKSLP